MIGHIFRKDLQLLWPWALALAGAQAASATLNVVLQRLGGPHELVAVVYSFPFLVLFGIVVLTIAVVHQDPLPALRQDWLVRPIRRGDLLQAKALFALLIIQAPIFVTDIFEQLALGLPLVGSIGSAAARGATLVCSLTLPALLLGAVTATLTEALFFGLLVSIGCAVAYDGLFLIILKPPSLPSGIYWIGPACAAVAIIAGSILTLRFAYASRRFLTARLLAVLVVLFALATSVWVPFNVAFAIQQQVSRSSGQGRSIQVTFQSGKSPGVSDSRSSKALTGETSQPTSAQGDGLQIPGRAAVRVRLPLEVSGLPQESILWADQVSVDLIGLKGASLYRSAGVCERLGVGMGRACRSYGLEVREKRSAGPSTAAQQDLAIPAAVYARLKDKPLRMELSYAFTLLSKDPTETIGALYDMRSVPGLGSCATRMDSDEDEVELRCISTTVAPSCATLVLEDPTSEKRNPELHLCSPNYTPFPLNIRDVLNVFGGALPFRDPSGLAHYPVDGKRVQSARISLTTHHATEHFRLELVIPDIRLAEWAKP